MTAFLERAEAALGTPQVAANEEGARRFDGLRRQASAAYPPMDEMRDRAREIRLHTLSRLDEYLAQFADAVEALGGTVFFAADASEATSHVAELLKARSAATVVKSKSMLTEEIELNRTLEEQGVDVVETDLGELIAQLAGDRPSHIIAPVLHLDRFDVGKLFERTLGVPYTDDHEELNAVARAHLRKLFLTADAGISGVNLAVAETGSICLVTNEGNGRLTTTAPRLHVAIMGAERIVPTVPDAAVVLEVLARSATGQKLSVYTNFVTGPRRAGEPDGPDELHVVIVDNGRSDTLGSDVSEILACIRCGACLNACPVYQTVGGHAYGSVYPGPMGSVLSPALFDLDEWADLPYASTLCGACLDACPVRIDLPGLLLRQRRHAVEAGAGPMWLRRPLRTYATVARRPRLFRFGIRLGALLTRGRWLSRLPGRAAGWTRNRDLPGVKGPFVRRRRHGS